MKPFVYGLVFVFIAIFLLAPFVFTSSVPSPSPTPTKTDIGELSEISFSQFKSGKKIFELTAKSMEDKGQIIVLRDVLGEGVTKDGKNFSFKANRVELKKDDHSFKAFGNIELFFSNKKVLGKEMIYSAKKDVYIIFHGIIYINSKVSISGRDIKFFPGLSKLVIGGRKDE